MTAPRKWVGLALFLIVSMLLMTEVFITAAILPELSAEFGVSKAALGFVGSAYILVGAAIGLAFGHWTDKRSRKGLLIIAVLLAQIPCLLTGLHWASSSFPAFVALRVLAGVGIGAVYPITLSLLADLFPADARARASALIDITWSVGLLLGPILGTWAAGTDYGWRAAFLAAGLPNLLVLPIFALVFVEPPRSETDQTSERGLAALRVLLSRRTNLRLFAQGIPGSIPWGMLPFWSIAYFTETQGLTKIEATGIWESFTLATAAGVIAWSWAGDRMNARAPTQSVRMIAGLSALGVLFIAAMVNMGASAQTVLLLTLPAGLFIAAPGPNVRAWLMNVNPGHQRGAVFSIFNLADNIGKGLGPAIGGAILALGGSMTLMMNIMIGCWMLHVVILYSAAPIYGSESVKQTHTA